MEGQRRKVEKTSRKSWKDRDVLENLDREAATWLKTEWRKRIKGPREKSKQVRETRGVRLPREEQEAVGTSIKYSEREELRGEMSKADGHERQVGCGRRTK